MTRRGALLVLPALVPTVVVLGAGLGTALLQALGLMPLVGEPRLGTGAFEQVDLGTSVRLSLAIATAATVLAAGIGLATAVAVLGLLGRVGHGRRSRLLGALSSLTIPLPHLVGAAAMGLLLADSGLLARVLGAEDWPQLVGGPWWTAVVAEFAWKESAFIALVVTGTLATRVASYEETAALLGATSRQRLWHVTLPLAAPALIASSALSFVYALGSYEVAALLGRAAPEPLPVLAYRLFTAIDLATRPQAAAVAVVTAALSVTVLLLALAALRRTPAWR